MSSSHLRKVAVIGHGYWGKNIARVFSQHPHFELHTVCDLSDKNLQTAAKLYPSARMVKDFREIGADVDVVAIMTTADTHFELAQYFLERNQHVMLAKPFTKTSKEAQELIQIAQRKNRVVFVDHTFVFNPAVRKLKEMLPQVGKPYFVMSSRMNLGLYRPDVNVIYDLMPHDLSIISYLFEQPFVAATTTAFKAAGLPQEDIAHTSFELKGGVKGHITAAWLSPSKVRTFYVVGSEGMLVYDDNLPTEKIKFYDTGISIADLNPDSNEAYTARISYRTGAMHSPAIPNTEALAFEVSELKRAIENPEVAREYDRLNLDIMKSLDVVLGREVAR
jgi:predicted dehydrogenase